MDIRLIKDGEAEKCNAFYNRIYNTKRSFKQWQWEFTENNYESPKTPYAVVEDNGNIIGTQAFIPIQMIDENGIFWTAKSEETLVDPSYRGKKLFEKMYKFLFEYAEEHNFAYIWGFTSATKAFIRLNFDIPYNTTQIFVPFSANAVSMLHKSPEKLSSVPYKIALGLAKLISSTKYILNKPSEDSSLSLKTLSEAPEDAGKLCEKFIEKYKGKTIYRDTKYLNWRIFQNPYVKGIFKALYVENELVGWVVYTLGDDGVGYLVDIMAVEDTNKKFTVEYLLKALLYQAVIGTRDMGAIACRGWHVTNHPFDQLLKKAAKSIGFYYVKKGHGAVIYSTGAASTRPSHNDFNSWFITRVFTEGVHG